MNHRPRIVTFIAWFCIVASAFCLVSMLWITINPEVNRLMDYQMSKDPVPLPFQYGLIYFNAISSMVCGIGMLAAKNWARLFYAGLSILWIITPFLFPSSQNQAIPSIIINFIILFFLFRPAANHYFSSTTFH